MSYRQARKDFEFLETIEECDETVEMMSQLMQFMENPNQKFAEGLYVSHILRWFEERELEEYGIMHKGKRLELKLFNRVKRIEARHL